MSMSILNKYYNVAKALPVFGSHILTKLSFEPDARIPSLNIKNP
jgi:hypothetical protein